MKQTSKISLFKWAMAIVALILILTICGCGGGGGGGSSSSDYDEVIANGKVAEVLYQMIGDGDGSLKDIRIYIDNHPGILAYRTTTYSYYKRAPFLHWSLYCKREDVAAMLLNDFSEYVDIEEQSDYNPTGIPEHSTPIFHAVFFNDAVMTKRLLEMGADYTVHNNYEKMTPLMVGAHNKSYAGVTALRDYVKANGDWGAYLGMTDLYGGTAFSYAPNYPEMLEILRN